MIGVPGAVTRVKFLEGYYLLPLVWVQLVQRSEHPVQNMGEGAAHMMAPVGQALIQPKEVTQKYVHIRQELDVGAEEEGVPRQRNQGSI